MTVLTEGADYGRNRDFIASENSATRLKQYENNTDTHPEGTET